MNYLETVYQIESRGIMPDRMPSLDPMREGLKKILPELQGSQSEILAKKTILIAGTNGKGSICATLETLLRAAGQTVGLYTSPHLQDTTERIRANGVQVSEEVFCQAFQAVDQRTHEIRLSHFETLTLMAAWIFYSQQISPALDWNLFEVGLGGTWDATNAIPHHYSILATLGYDHQNILGNSIEEIAANKFGIVQKGGIVIHSPLPEEVIPLAIQIQRMTESHWTASTPFSLEIEKKLNPLFKIKTQWGGATLALPGIRGAQNTATALTAFHALGFSPQHFLSSLKDIQWPGRMNQLKIEPGSPLKSQLKSPARIFLSGDHNPQGIQSLLEILPHYPRNHLFILVGIGKDKDRDGILGPLFDLKDTSIFLTETPFRGLSLQEYGPWLNQPQSQAFAKPLEALQKIADQATAEDLILVTGSLYLVGLIQAASCLSPN